MRPTRMSGVGLALVISLAIDQIFCFAPSMRPDMEPVVSSTKQTSIFGLSFFSGGSSFARALAATSNVHVSSVATVYVPLTLALSRRERAGVRGTQRLHDTTGWHSLGHRQIDRVLAFLLSWLASIGLLGVKDFINGSIHRELDVLSERQPGRSFRLLREQVEILLRVELNADAFGVLQFLDGGIYPLIAVLIKAAPADELRLLRVLSDAFSGDSSACRRAARCAGRRD